MSLFNRHAKYINSPLITDGNDDSNPIDEIDN